MKVLAVFMLFGALAAAIPMPSEETKSEVQTQPEEQKQDTLSSVDVNAHGDNANKADNADRSKRFIFFSKIFYPYPATYTKVYAAPVVTPIVTKTKVVAPAPVAYTYKVKPVTYQYTYSVPTYTIVKSAPVVKTVSVAAPSVTVTKTATVAQATAVDDDDE